MESLKEMRYLFSEHASRAGWYSVFDADYDVRCDFEAHRFNEIQEFSGLDKLPADPDLISRIMRELGDWIALHHYSEAMPVPTYEYREAEDGETVSIIRHKDPRFTIRAATGVDTSSDRFAAALRKAAEFVKKLRRRE